MLERSYVLLVHEHCLIVACRVRSRLLLEASSLVVGVIELRDAVNELSAHHEGLETLDEVGIAAMTPRQRRRLRRVVGHERRLDKR